MLTHKIGSKLYLQPESMYSQKGYYYEIARNNKGVFKDTVMYREKTQLNYLDIPILARAGTNRFYMEAGPQLSFFMNGRRTETRTTNSNGIVTDHQHTRDLIGFADDFDIGFTGGFGYQTDLGLGLGLRFNQSFKELVHREKWKRNVVVQLSTFYILGKRKEILAEKAPVPITIPNPDIDYYDKRKANKKAYTIIGRTNMPRVSFTKVAESEQMHVQFKIITTGFYTPQDILIAGSSGIEENTGLFLGFRNVQFPFEGSIQFSTSSGGGSTLVQSRMEYEIKEPGFWRITITVSQ
ncbi:hypothetical protein GCM10027293_33420 [Pontibacter aydingkolensis]